MSKFGVSPSKLKSQAAELASVQSVLESSRDRVDSVMSGLSFNGSATEGVRNRLRSVSRGLEGAGRNMRSMRRVLTEIASAYSNTEQRIKTNTVLPKITVTTEGDTFVAKAGAGAEARTYKEDGKIGVTASASAAASAAVAQGSITAESEYGTASASGKVLSASAEAGASAGAYISEDGTLMEARAEANARAKASVAEGEASFDSKYAAASVSGSLVAAEAAASATAAIGSRYGVVYGELSASAEAKTYVAQGEVSGRLGTENLNANVKAEGSLVGAGAEAKAGVSFDSLGHAKAEAKVGAEAYLAKGEVKGGFNILGIKIETGLEGMVGVQAEAKGEVGSSGFELELGLGPVGGKLNIDWSGFKLPDFSKVNWTFWK